MDPAVRAWHVEWFVDGDNVRRDVSVQIGSGRVVGVRPGYARGAIDLGKVAMIPGLVNAHTHLEFSSLSEPIPTTGRFTDWIRKVVQYRREHPTETANAIQRGVAECLRSGTTLIGDIATTGWHCSDYSQAGFHGVIFQELLGLGDERVAAQCDLARQSCSHEPEVLVRFGLSPHAPYSVHPELFRTAIQCANEASQPENMAASAELGQPTLYPLGESRQPTQSIAPTPPPVRLALAMHLAETKAELELLAEGTGEFREMLTEFGIWRDGLFGGKTPRDYLEALAQAPRALVIHGNYLTDAELQFLAAHPNMTLVYCPRTHAAFGHRNHPWQRLKELGGAVAIGTDSKASNPDLSLFAELQFLAARHPDVSHLDLLHMGTTAGETALLGPSRTGDGCGEHGAKSSPTQNIVSTPTARTASTSGGRADFCVVGLDQPDLDPAQSLFAAKNRVVGTMLGGRWHRAEL